LDFPQVHGKCGQTIPGRTTAGYPYSAIVAASAFNQIDKNKKYDNIFVIGSSHRVAFDGATIYNKGNFETPLGIVKVNIELANKLMNESDIFTYHELAHINEHSLEVQLPIQHGKISNFEVKPSASKYLFVIATKNGASQGAKSYEILRVSGGVSAAVVVPVGVVGLET
jgi:predicted class III extradiol MEMO1 family dioxygenase